MKGCSQGPPTWGGWVPLTSPRWLHQTKGCRTGTHLILIQPTVEMGKLRHSQVKGVCQASHRQQVLAQGFVICPSLSATWPGWEGHSVGLCSGHVWGGRPWWTRRLPGRRQVSLCPLLASGR